MRPRRLKRQAGRHALVDGIPFDLPVNSQETPALMAVFTIDAKRAAALLPGTEVHPMRVTPKRGLLVITVINYVVTDIGRYIEYSIAIACTRGKRTALPLLPGLLMKPYGTGQYVYDLPVSSEVSVKGGKGIWGMPKHQANLDFVIGEKTVSSQYDLDGQLAMRVEIDKPKRAGIPLSTSGINYCAFRGMLMRSFVYFKGKAGINRPFSPSGRLVIGDHPRVAALKNLDIAPKPLLTAWLPETAGVLDDHYEGWFLSYDEAPAAASEGLESVFGLGRGEDWLEPPSAPIPGNDDRSEDPR